MGMFYETVKVFNRAPVAVSVVFDGQELSLPPGPGTLLRVALRNAKNQNPIMGSVDPNNTHIEGGQYLLGVVDDVEWPGDPCEPLSKEEWATHLGKPCRTDEQAEFAEKYGNDPKAKLVTLGKGRKSTALNRNEAAVPKGGVVFAGRE